MYALTTNVKTSMSALKKHFPVDLEPVVPISLDGTSVHVLLHWLVMPTDLRDVDPLFLFASTMPTAPTVSSVIPKRKNVTKNVERQEVVNENLLDVVQIMIVVLPRSAMAILVNVTTLVLQLNRTSNVNVDRMRSVKPKTTKQLVLVHRDTKDIRTKYVFRSRNVVSLTTVLET